MDLEVLRKAPLFTNLDDEVFAILTSELTEVELSRGASAFHEGDQGDQLYVIMSGKIKLGRTASDGRENLVAVLGPGEIFGEMALFNPAPRSATATAVSATRLAGLRHENLRRAIGSSPDVSVQLLQALAQRLSKTNESLADLVFSDVPGRVAKALLDLADRFGRRPVLLGGMTVYTIAGLLAITAGTLVIGQPVLVTLLSAAQPAQRVDASPSSRRSSSVTS